MVGHIDRLDLPYVNDADPQPIGHDGGIVKMPATMKGQEQAMGIGATVYYLVSNVEQVRMVGGSMVSFADLDIDRDQGA